MSSHRPLAITLLGLSAQESRLVKSICSVTTSRPKSYFVLENTQQIPDIYVANVDTNEVLSQAVALSTAHQIPTIYISKSTKTVGEYQLKTPISPAKLLKIFEIISLKNISSKLAHPDDTELADTTQQSLLNHATTQSLPRNLFHALVVDDSPTVRKQLELALKLMGGTVDCVDSGESAVLLLNTTHYDMIFLDVVLPNADGYKVCRAIKKSPKKKNIPVIMLTSKSSPFDKVRGSLAGCNSYLTKPVKNSVFQEIVHKYIPQDLSSDQLALA